MNVSDAPIDCDYYLWGRYKEKRYPENVETLVMHNCSPLKAEINFCFQHDTKAATFMLDPPSMTLHPNEKQVQLHHLRSSQ